LPSRSEAATASLDTRGLAIGREPGEAPSLELDDTEASRLHAALVHEAATDTFWVEDRGSRNGTFVDGKREDRAALRHGSVVRIGRSLLVFVDIELRADERLEPETPALRGRSLLMQRVRGEIAMVASRNLPVLVLGETGVGKERVAQEIHRESGRRGAFTAVNCAAIPAALAESELFGHAAGAFTGATARAEGLFVAADGGTLFLDEVGELPPELQAKLLRVLVDGEVRAVGRTEARKVDVRVVAATNRDVAQSVGAGTFRADLHARLAGWTVDVPPLRARKDDLLRLARNVLERDGGRLSLSANAAEALLLHAWPYNVRELEQVVQAACVRAERGGVLRCEHLPEPIAAPIARRSPSRTKGGGDSGAPPEPPLEALVARDAVPTADQLRVVLRRFDGNVAHAAEYFGKDRRQIYRWAEKLGVELDELRGA
jgi:transcriptional regulator with GAF, ATPase, and Fis domain